MSKTRVISTQAMLDADFQMNLQASGLLTVLKVDFGSIRGPLHPDTSMAFESLCWAIKELLDTTGQHLEVADYRIGGVK